jgi:hypothetical protein
MTDEERAAIMQESIEALRPHHTEAPRPEPIEATPLPTGRYDPMPEYRRQAEAAQAARKRADEELKRESRQGRDAAAAADISMVINLVDQKFDECGKMILEGASAAREAGEMFADQICDLKNRVRTLETELTKAHTAAADARVAMVELRTQLVDAKGEWLARVDALSLMLHKALGDAAALRSVEDAIGRRLDGLKLVVN